ncbi:MAG: DUF885 domain-containing protein [Vicinamibacteria bacterium]|nr:DUF885 domain-containing protein [Vicinamibacteria bacterium]
MRGTLPRALGAALLALVGWTPAPAQPASKSAASLVSGYVERYFDMYPTRATEAGRHDRDAAIEDFSAPRIAAWIEFNRATLASIPAASRTASAEDRLDLAVIRAQIDRELLDLDVLRRRDRDPLFWTAPLSNATVFLLVRDDLPRDAALTAARQRVSVIPPLARAAREAFEAADPSTVAPEHARLAAGQASSLARFYAEGFAQAFPPGEREGVQREAQFASLALEDLAGALDALARSATGKAQLGPRYSDVFRVGTGLTEPPASVLARAERALVAKRKEVAAYARSVFAEVTGETGAPPRSDAEVIRRAFAAIADDKDPDLDTYTAGWKRNTVDVERFIRGRKVMTLKDPLTLKIDVSPAYFTGQSVGGVYAAGPWSPGASTILFLPVPRTGASAEEADAFYRDFNRGFNRMIVAHELIPGHYTQLKYAAHHPRKVRALFADPVYVEGWGTFCERLVLDLGFGNSRARLAHLKKQLENIARTIVDIRVHTKGMTEAQVKEFVTKDAFQGEQLARNMWMRTLTTAPQITSYFLGYDQVKTLYEDVRRARGSAFVLRRFMDGMMELGPVPVAEYRRRLLPAPK